VLKSFKQLTNEYERLKKSEEFKDLTSDDLLNKDIIQRIQKKRVNSSPSEKEQLDSYIKNAMQKALLNTYHDPKYPEKLDMAWSKSSLADNAQRELETSPRNWLTKTSSGEYDVDTNKLKESPLSFSALKHIKDMSPENAKKIMEKLKDSPELSESPARTAKAGAISEIAKFAPLEALFDKDYTPWGAYAAIKEKTKDFTEHPISLDKLKELHGKRYYGDDTSYVGKVLSNYVLSHPDTPKEDLLSHIQNNFSPSSDVLTHKSLSPEDIKHAVRLRLANQKGVLDNLEGLNTKEKVDKGLAVLEGLHEYAKTNPGIHQDMIDYGLHKLALNNVSEEVTEHALNKLLERYNNKNYLSNDPKAAAAIRGSLAHSINSVIHPDSPASQKVLIEIAKGTHSIKDKTGKIKENDLLDNILNTRRFRTDGSQNFVNEVRRHVIESGHAPSIQSIYKQWGSAWGVESQKAELEHLTNKFDDKTLAKIVPHMDAAFLRKHVFSNQELSQKILPHLSSAAKAKLEKDGALGGISKEDSPLSFSSNTEMLRKLRDVAEANGGSISAKQLGQHGLNENSLKITHLKDAKGNYTKEAIQKHIDSMPKHNYDYSHTSWKGAQVHSNEKQYVFQLNHNEDLLNEMKNAGVYDTFAKTHELSFNSDHPVKDNTLGWVRYTKGKDGHIHIDEIQSDLGRSLHGSIKEYLEKQPESPKKKKLEELFSKEKIDKMNDILFKGQHPSKIIHEGFLQFLRNNGNVGKDIHIWQAMPKAKLAGQDTVGNFSLRGFSDNIDFHKKVEANKPIEDFDAGEIEQAARAFIGPEETIKIYDKHAVYSPGTATQGPEEIGFNLENFKNDVVNHPLYKLAISHIKAHATNDDLASAREPLEENASFDDKVSYPYTINELPVHMKIGYQELPPKLDYTPDSYGKIQTQKTKDLKDQPTWKTNLRKSLKALTAEYERLKKATDPYAYINNFGYSDESDDLYNDISDAIDHHNLVSNRRGEMYGEISEDYDTSIKKPSELLPAHALQQEVGWLLKHPKEEWAAKMAEAFKQTGRDFSHIIDKKSKKELSPPITINGELVDGFGRVHLAHALGENVPVFNYKRKRLRKSFGSLTAEYERLTKADAPVVKLNPEHGRMIADAYHNMKHDPSHPEVKASYDALINETKQQYKDLLASGLKISKIQPNMDNPYPTSKHLHADMTNNNHMWYYPTSLGFGSEDSIPHDHPMLRETEFKDPEGKPMLANDVFRVVHDSVHNKLKNGFGPKGEHESFLEHKKTYSPLAQKALATETMGQNNYVNFSSQIGHLNRAKPGSAYAPQKAGLMPDEIINKDWHS
jgi:hypothetical protein